MKKLFILATFVLGCCALTQGQFQIFPGSGVLPPPLKLSLTGFFGQSLVCYHSATLPYFDGEILPPCHGSPFKTYVSVYDVNGTLVKRIASNPVGQFYSHVKPGNYLLIATPSHQSFPPKKVLPDYQPNYLSVGPISITVSSNQFTQVAIDYVISP